MGSKDKAGSLRDFIMTEIYGAIISEDKEDDIGKATDAILQAITDHLEASMPEKQNIVHPSLMYDSGYKTGYSEGIAAYHDTILRSLK